MKLSPSGYALIKRFEQLVLTAYLCPANKLTIGYGHTGSDVHQGQVITEERANELLRQDVQRFEQCVNESITRPLNQNQFDALVSFCFNVGDAAFKSSTLRRVINNGCNSQSVHTQLLRWIHGNGKVIHGLVVRRNREYELYAKPVD